MTVTTITSFSKLDSRRREVKLIQEVIQRLQSAYPNAHCGLNYKTPFQLLIATILLTQTTEEKVNEVLPILFEHFPTPSDFTESHRLQIETVIRPTGFHRQKAKFIQETSRVLLESYNGRVPTDMSALVQLPGISRKTANIILGELYNIAEGISVDTHVHRVANRLRLSSGKNATKVENELMKVVPQEYWIETSYLFAAHGQNFCYVRRPNCRSCPLKDICPAAPS